MRVLAKLKQIRITNEAWVLALLVVGPPLIAYVYLDWRAALTAFVVTQIVVGIIKERYN